MKNLILPGANTRLLDKRFEDEAQSAERNDEFGKRFKMGAPDLPDAQIVLGPNGPGVAIKGARFVCQLPPGYSGQGLALNVMPGGHIVVTHPSHSPLLIDAQRGTTRPL